MALRGRLEAAPLCDGLARVAEEPPEPSADHEGQILETQGCPDDLALTRMLRVPFVPSGASPSPEAPRSNVTPGSSRRGSGTLAGPMIAQPGLVRSKSVMDRLDARFKGAALFDRAPASDDAEWPMDEALMSLARRRRSFGGARLFRFWATALAQDPGLRAAVVLTAGGGAATLGTVGGACGLVLGSAVGAAAGTAPALLTFGLSIPTGALAGGTLGCNLGAVASGTVGLVAGAALGAAAYQSSEQLLSCAASARVSLVVVPVDAVLRAIDQAAADHKVRAAAASAAGGAVALGTSGGALGLLLGGATGAAWGVIPSVVTFGLSIPICATVMGTLGMWTGVAMGGAAGLAGGGAVGYGAAVCAGDRSFQECVDHVKEKARSWSRGAVMAEPGGTGGTA